MVETVDIELAAHHAVLRNLDIETCKHEGRFCGHFSRVVVSDFRSLRGDIVFTSLSGRLSPAAKIPFQTRIGQADCKSAQLKRVAVRPIPSDCPAGRSAL